MRSAQRAALGGHDRAVGDEDAGDDHRLLEEAAAVVAQIEDDALRAPRRSSASIACADLAVRAGGERRRARRPSFSPPDRCSRRDDRDVDARALERHARAGFALPRDDGQLTAVPAGPLISAVACSEVCRPATAPRPP